VTFPPRITVGPHVFHLTYDRNIGDRGANGETYRESCRILIADNLATSIEREVVLHESLHALYGATNLDGDQEEATVQALTAPLLDLLRCNPSFVSYLTLP
jgi:hypothetical protein